MADYGYYRKKKRVKQRRGFWSTVLLCADIVMLICTALCSITLIFAYLAKYIDPSKWAVFAFAGLVFPVLYVAQTILALYWLMRWKRLAIAVAAVLLLGLGDARLFYKLSFMKHYRNDKPLKSELVVMSYNVMQFSYPNPGNKAATVKHIAQFVKENNVDILCIQEYDNEQHVRNTFRTICPDLKHSYFRHYSVRSSEEGTKGVGLAIYSRYPILGKGIIDSDPETLHSMWADIRIKRDTVRVVNNHLQSTYINNSDVDYLSSFRVPGAQERKQIGHIVAKLRDNYVRRAPQAKSIAGFIAMSPYPAIVCGDFNDTPASYSYHIISHGLRDTFVLKGRGTAGTYNGFFNMFRIDYILMSDGMEVSSYYPFDVVYSDHNPIAASFYFSKR